MPCMKRPFNTETEANANRRRMNDRKGGGPTHQVAYPCPDCSEDFGPVTWHLRTERPIEGKLIRLDRKRGVKRRRPSPRPWENEDYEGNWAA